MEYGGAVSTLHLREIADGELTNVELAVMYWHMQAYSNYAVCGGCTQRKAFVFEKIYLSQMMALVCEELAAGKGVADVPTSKRMIADYLTGLHAKMKQRGFADASFCIVKDILADAARMRSSHEFDTTHRN